MKKITISAPGKIILSGEHAVVYGYPALAAAIDRRLFLTTKNLTFNTNGRQYQILGQRGKRKESFVFEINSEIPVRCGLGSSAALAVVQAAACVFLRTSKLRSFPECLEKTTPGVEYSKYFGNLELDKEIINKMAFCLEKLTHGNPSGVDNTIVTFGGILLFQKGKKPKAIKVKKLPEFLLINTGKSEETTKEMIGIVNSKLKTQNSKLQLKTKNLLNFIGKLPEQFVESFNREDFSQLKWLMTRNERLLEELGVVGQRAKKTVHLIEQLGGVAKICGAGGIKKGSGTALVYHPKIEIIKDFCQRKRLDFFEVKLGGEGLRIDEQ